VVHLQLHLHLFFELTFILQAVMGGAKELVEAGVYGLHGWAMLEQKLGNWSEARELLPRAADIQPGNAVVHQTRALLEAQAHNYASARHHFRLGVTSAPEDVKCWQVSIAPSIYPHFIMLLPALL